MSIEPEPTPKSPFIRAFAKIRDDSIDKQFSAILEVDEDLLSENGEHNISDTNSENSNECTFNYKVSNVVTQEIVYSMGANDDEGQEIADHARNQQASDSEGDQQFNGNDCNENGEVIQNGNDVDTHNDEGIEMEMPNLEHSENSEESSEIPEDISVDEIVEAPPSPPRNTPSPVIEPIMPEKVSLDDIQRELYEMQLFLMHKGLTSVGESNGQKWYEESNTNDYPTEVNECQQDFNGYQDQENGYHVINSDEQEENSDYVDDPIDSEFVEVALDTISNDIHDAYQVEVCLPFNQRKDSIKQIFNGMNSMEDSFTDSVTSNNSERSSDFISRSEDESIKLPISAYPNKAQNFSKLRFVPEKPSKKQQKTKQLDVSWQKLVENQKKNYK